MSAEAFATGPTGLATEDEGGRGGGGGIADGGAAALKKPAASTKWLSCEGSCLTAAWSSPAGACGLAGVAKDAVARCMGRAGSVTPALRGTKPAAADAAEEESDMRRDMSSRCWSLAACVSLGLVAAARNRDAT